MSNYNRSTYSNNRSNHRSNQRSNMNTYNSSSHSNPHLNGQRRSQYDYQNHQSHNRRISPESHHQYNPQTQSRVLNRIPYTGPEASDFPFFSSSFPFPSNFPNLNQRSNFPPAQPSFFNQFDQFFQDFNDPFFSPNSQGSRTIPDAFNQINFFIDNGLRRTSNRRNRDRNLIDFFLGHHASSPNFDFNGFHEVFNVGRNRGLDIAQVLQALSGLTRGSGQQAHPGNVSRMKDVRVNSEVIKKCKVCTVCQEDFKIGEMVKELPCEHYFHDDCIKPWLQSQNTCPMCRATI